MRKKAEEITFEKAIEGKKFKNPETGNDVVFSSLPAEEQKKVRAEFDKKKKELDSQGSKGSTKNKSVRDEVKKKAVESLAGLADDLYSSHKDYESVYGLVESKYTPIFEAYGIENGDISHLSEEELEDLTNTVDELDTKMTEDYVNKIEERSKEREAKIEELKGSISDKKEKLRISLKRVRSSESKLKELKDPKGKDKEEALKLEKEIDSLHEEIIPELQEEVYQLGAELGWEEDQPKRSKEIHSLFDDTFYGTDFQFQDGEFLFRKGDSPISIHVKAKSMLKDKKKKREIEERMKEEEEKLNAKVKEYKKKLSDLASKVKGTKKKEDLSGLVSEVGRIKGQLSESPALDKLKADFDKLEKEFEEARERTSFKGKLKSFFGLGKKASNQQLVRLAHKVLLKEIEDFKRDFPDYK